MHKARHFENLIPFVLRSVPYIHQSHTCKAYYALEQLYALRPQLSDEVWNHCVSIIKNDEPKVEGVIEPELLKIDKITDETTGRIFGPDWILKRGLMPMSYWAMTKKVDQIGFEEIVKEYAVKALENPRYLGHEISILSAYWYFYKNVVVSRPKDDQILFLQRFTEFITATFTNGELDMITHPVIKVSQSEQELLLEALKSPGFFGHHVLANVWGNRLKPLLNPSQQDRLLHTYTVLNGNYGAGTERNTLIAHDREWTEDELDLHLTTLFCEGPKNIHQITLAEALLWCWSQYPNYRRLVQANILCFSQRVRP